MVKNIKLTILDKVWLIEIIRESYACAINKNTANDLIDFFLKFEKDENACVAILTGKGKYFCSGADLKEIDKAGKGIISNMNEIDPDGNAPLGISRILLTKPVIAAINGYAVAGGLELALWCDLRISYDECIMGVFCRRYGVPLIDGGTVRLQALIGLSRAMDLILTGREIDGSEAYKIGLVNFLVKKDEVIKKALEIAHKISNLPQLCLRTDRMSLITNAYDLKLDKLLKNEFNYGIVAINKGDFYKGAEQFTRGLKPKF